MKWPYPHILAIYNGGRRALAVLLPMFSLAFASTLPLPKVAALLLFASSAGYYLPQLALMTLIDRAERGR